MHRFRSWTLDPPEWRTQRNRGLPIEGGDGSTLTLDFTTGILDPRLSFTRGTNATFINSQGLVQWADANMVTGSELCNPALYGWNSQQSPGYLFDTSVNDPFGNPGVPRLTSNATLGSSAVTSSSFAVSAGFTYTLTFWVRAGTSTTFLVGIYDATAGAFTPASGTILSGPGNISGTGAIALTNLTSAWTKVRVYFTPANTAASRAISFYPQAAASGGQSNYLWGIQFNIGQTPNPTYFKTVATAYYAPRFDHDPITRAPRGLLIEGEVVNLAALGTGSNSNTTFSIYNTGASPNFETVTLVSGIDGISNSAARFTLSAAGFLDGRYQNVPNALSTFSVTNGAVYTASFYYKATRSGSPLSFNTRLTHSGGTIQTPTSSIDLPGPNGFTRRVVTFTAAASVYGVVWIYGGGFQAGDTFDITAIQVEAGSSATSYIPVGSTAGTRTQDTATMAVTAAQLGFDGYRYTMLVRGRQTKNAAASSFARTVRLHDASTEQIGLPVSNNTLYGTSRNTSNVAISEVSVANTLNQDFRFAWALDADLTTNTMLGSLNQSPLSANRAAIGPMGNMTTLAFNTNSAPASNYASMTIRDIKFWPRQMTASELNALTR
jgi:hypothetical protein